MSWLFGGVDDCFMVRQNVKSSCFGGLLWSLNSSIAGI